MEKRSLGEKISHFVVFKPWISLFMGMLILSGFSVGLKKLQADFSYRVWYDKKDPNLKKFDLFEKKFGNDSSIVIAFDTKDGLFNNKNLKILRELTEKMWLVKRIIRVESLTNYQWTHSEGDDIIVEDFIPDDEKLSEKFLNQRKKIALQDEVMPGFLISKDLKTALLYARVVPVPGVGIDYKETVVETREVLAELKKYKDVKFYISGSAAMGNAFKEVAESDTKKMLPFLFISIIIFLLIFFKSVSGVILPFLVIIFTTMATLGFSGHIAEKMNNMTAMVPNILIAICMADSIHLIASYLQYSRRNMEGRTALFEALKKNIFPLFMTSLSTSIGFFSLTNSEIMPVYQLGILGGLGTLLGFVFTILFLAPMLSVLPMKVKSGGVKEVEKNDNPHPISEKAVNLLIKYNKSILVVFFIIFCFAFYLGSQNVINSNPYKYFGDNVPLKQANDFILKKLGGSAGPEVVINSGEKEGIKDPIFLKKVETLQEWINQSPRVNKTFSIINILKSMNRSLHGDDQNFYKLPQTRNEVAQQLFLYTMSLPQGMDLNNRMTLDKSSLRLSVLWDLQDSNGSLKMIDKIEKKAKSLGLDSYVTGKLPIYQKLEGYLVTSFFTSISVALFLVGLLLIFIFKSVKLGLLSLIPNIYPLVCGAGIIKLMEKDIDIGTALVTSVCLGIAVDDTIHFLIDFNRKMKKSGDLKLALAQVFTFTGPALIFTTIILAAGFGVFAFADFAMNYNFGVLSAAVFVSALVIDLVLLPSILIKLYGGSIKKVSL